MEKENNLKKFKERERDFKKNVIIDAAERVFAIKPYNKVSMQEIAEEAGLAKSSIYTYFPSQESLFLETAVRDLDVLLEQLRSIIKKGNFEIRSIINTFIDYFVMHDSFFRMSALFMLYGNLSSESIETLNPALKSMLDLFDNAFLKLGYTQNVRIHSHTLFSSLSGILISYRKYPGRTNEEVVSHMKRVGKNVSDMFNSLLKKE